MGLLVNTLWMMMNNMDYSVIKCSSTWENIEKLNKGWSKDIKYIVTDINDNKFLSSVFLNQSVNSLAFL